MVSSQPTAEEVEELLQGLSMGPRLVEELRAMDSAASARLFPPLIAVLRELRPAVPPPSPPKALDPSGGARDPFEEAMTVWRGISLLTPKGKFDLCFCPHHMVFKGTRDSFRIEYKHISFVAVLDDLPKDTRKRVLVMLSLSSDFPITYGKQEAMNVVIQTFAETQASIADPRKEGRVLNGTEAVVLATILGKMGVGAAKFRSTDRACFTSDDKFCAVGANMKVTEGFLFPLLDAIAYVGKNPQYIIHSDVKTVEFVRTTSPGSTFDFNIHLMGSDSIIEFGQLDKRQIWPLQCYLKDRGLKSGPPASASDSEEEGEGDQEDDEEDEDFDPEAEEGDEEATGALEVDDEEDEDEFVSDEDNPSSPLQNATHAEDEQPRKKAREGSS